MNNTIIPYGKQNITKEDIDAVIETLKSDFLTQGPKVKEFEDKVKSGAQTLETEQSYERMILTDWIMQFNEMMERNDFPFDKLFRDHDLEQ
jgi:hypothetical protein